jgi:hypothetical protein
MKLTFGKYNGWDIERVPDDYIQYMIESNEKSLKMFKAESERRASVVDAKLPMMERIIQAGYRQLAMQNHPDKGGSGKMMQDINAAHEKLKSMAVGK